MVWLRDFRRQGEGAFVEEVSDVAISAAERSRDFADGHGGAVFEFFFGHHALNELEQFVFLIFTFTRGRGLEADKFKKAFAGDARLAAVGLHAADVEGPAEASVLDEFEDFVPAAAEIDGGGLEGDERVGRTDAESEFAGHRRVNLRGLIAGVFAAPRVDGPV